LSRELKMAGLKSTDQAPRPLLKPLHCLSPYAGNDLACGGATYCRVREAAKGVKGSCRKYAKGCATSALTSPKHEALANQHALPSCCACAASRSAAARALCRLPVTPPPVARPSQWIGQTVGGLAAAT
jgi:hypothetical protein